MFIEWSQSTQFLVWDAHRVLKRCSQSTQFVWSVHRVLTKYSIQVIGTQFEYPVSTWYSVLTPSQSTHLFKFRTLWVWGYSVLTPSQSAHLNTLWVHDTWNEYFLSTLWALYEHLTWIEYFVSTLWTLYEYITPKIEYSMSTVWAPLWVPYLLCVGSCFMML